MRSQTSRPATGFTRSMRMKKHRILSHPILKEREGREVEYLFNGEPVTGYEGEMISSALFAVGITIFGHHARDGGAQGIFCANGQCSQCMVMVNGKPVKACMTPVEEGIDVRSVEGLPELLDTTAEDLSPTAFPEIYEVQVLIIGGGPAGLNGGIELGKLGVKVLVVDDKDEAGGKLSLQTHNFFGSVADCYAGTRGVDIGHHLTDELLAQKSVELWLSSTVVAVYSDRLLELYPKVCTGWCVLMRCWSPRARERKLSCFRGRTSRGSMVPALSRPS